MRLPTLDPRRWSRFAPQFNSESLRQSLLESGVDYVFLGAELGGRPEGERFYDNEGHVLYGKVAMSSAFARGLDRLETGARTRRVAMLCSEEDPTHCHRRLLVARVLLQRGVNVIHIRGDGRAQPESELEDALGEAQQTLFGSEEASWRSTRSVSHRRPRATSSVD